MAVERDDYYAPPRFENFLEIECPEDMRDPFGLADVLREFSLLVEYAYVVPEFSDPVNTADDPLFVNQGYLGTKGINAAAAWAKNSTGVGKELVDLENGWFLAHEDLPQ